MNGLELFDRQLTLYLNQMHSPFTDWLWITMSDVKFWYPLYIFLIVYLFRSLGWKRAAVALLGVILTIVACDQLSNLVKAAVERPRPCMDADMLSAGIRMLENRSGRFGFFSAHAANAFGLAASSLGALKLLGEKGGSRAYGYAIFFWAFLVSISRIFVGKHFLGDVLVGAAAGLVIGSMAAYISKIICKHSGI